MTHCPVCGQTLRNHENRCCPSWNGLAPNSEAPLNDCSQASSPAEITEGLGNVSSHELLPVEIACAGCGHKYTLLRELLVPCLGYSWAEDGRCSRNPDFNARDLMRLGNVIEFIPLPQTKLNLKPVFLGLSHSACHA